MNDAFRLSTCDGNGPDLLVCRDLEAKGLPHGFSLRWRQGNDATERHPYGRSLTRDSDFQDVTARLGTRHLVPMKQVHGAKLAVVDEPPERALVCDGLLTRKDDIGLVVQTADCVPMLMWDAEHNVVAAVHAGWRGTLSRIAEKAINKFQDEFHSHPKFIYVAMGPAIGSCCYEVGPEVVDAFTQHVAAVDGLFSLGPRGRQHFDVLEANRRQLVTSGVSQERIYSTGLCTSCDNSLLYSYRKEGKGTGRLYGAVGVAPS